MPAFMMVQTQMCMTMTMQLKMNNGAATAAMVTSLMTMKMSCMILVS